VSTVARKVKAEEACCGGDGKDIFKKRKKSSVEIGEDFSREGGRSSRGGTKARHKVENLRAPTTGQEENEKKTVKGGGISTVAKRLCVVPETCWKIRSNGP